MIRAYARSKAAALGLYAGTLAVLAGACLLYGLPGEAVGYCALLLAALLLMAGVVGYVRYRLRLEAIEGLEQNLQEALPQLPLPGDRLEAAYQGLVARLYQDRARRASQADAARRDMMDYYTLWAHQIKTPLAAMHLLLQSPAGPRPGELKGQLIQVEGYVEMVLSYLRLDSESSDFVFARQPLEPIVRGAVRKLARLFILKNIRLELPPLTLQALTDAKWLAFVFEQLLTNAVKYTPAGGTVSIRAEGDELVIADSGIGIRGEDLPRIFEKGFTGLNGREEQRSTGLGLYLCRRVLDQLGHDIRIVSSPGAGTQVFLRFAQDQPLYE